MSSVVGVRDPKSVPLSGLEWGPIFGPPSLSSLITRMSCKRFNKVDVVASVCKHPRHPTLVDFKDSTWLTRGWTLQELIAPLEINLYSKEWEPIGTKSEITQYLEEITGIDQQVLQGAYPSICSVASRMSWAANRKTNRIEDMAYSLLGMFDINMPLLYGEGGKAFIRLQEEIMKDCNDQSLFAWETSDPVYYSGLLATSPKHFARSKRITSSEYLDVSEPSSTSSKGLRARLDLVHMKGGFYYGVLKCKSRETGHDVAVVLQHIWADQFPKNANAYEGSHWYWIRGTNGIQFTDPVSYWRWDPAIGLFGLHPSHCGRILVTHVGIKNQPMSLLFGTREGAPYCFLDEPKTGSSDLESNKRPSYKVTTAFHSRPFRPLETPTVGYTEISMTAGASRVRDAPFPTFVITLCLKTSRRLDDGVFTPFPEISNVF
ncbi:uncharacterized protein K460DRAFT_350850 [Cucurbitaria berberidis CBS 394.84]|uniref:DUF8212 domain-containing protein n=1 Tax=Cucurbitaria berberidis CBS 394.84 TaxID=1168544 RepID=A0A9P4GQH7_9PLEO|nr:uncharacterized protein K460DRAFT_350850 [Cucurbitaria berberidis CBS 394.84]KAF1850848.1 hypothetical protein K460DRAFT_350850 [Cucurbitaria berberidis CBS 394.84]